MGCEVTATGSASSSTTTPKPGTTVGKKPVPVPRGGTGGIVRDWRTGRIGGAARFMIEPSIGPKGTVVNLYGTFRPALGGGPVACTFAGAQPMSPYFVSLRRMIVRVPDDARSGPVTCEVGKERLFTGRFVVTAEVADIFVPVDEEQGLLGAVWKIPAGTDKLPDFASLGDPIGTFVVPTIYTSARPFNAGFPGVESEGEAVKEWYAVRYVGLVNATREAEYTFRMESSDGAKLYIDDKLVIDNDGVHGPTAKEGMITLPKGKHRIVVEYFKTAGAQIALTLSWKRGSNEFTSVAKHSLSRYAVEYDCSAQPLTMACCKALTPACRMCAERQRVAMDSWRAQCTGN